jgi:hypothetical protein
MSDAVAIHWPFRDLERNHQTSTTSHYFLRDYGSMTGDWKISLEETNCGATSDKARNPPRRKKWQNPSVAVKAVLFQSAMEPVFAFFPSMSHSQEIESKPFGF